VIAEAVRLLITLATTAMGFSLARSWSDLFPSSTFDADAALIWLVLLGAGFGYVLGGIAGRALSRALDDAPGWFVDTTGGQLFAGGFGLMVGVVVGVVLSAPIVALLPPIIAWPLASLVVLVVGVISGKVFSSRGGELSLARSARPRRGTNTAGVFFVLDSSAAIDGRVLELARAGLITGRLMVPTFVIDEMQGLADAGGEKLRHRGRRGLDVLDALRRTPGVALDITEDGVPEHPEVDAKLLSVALDRDAALITTDHNLAQAAGLRGITVVNPHALGESLRPTLAAGDRISVTIARAGSEPGQGVGYLDDGTMVVVNGAANSIGETVDVEIANMLRTNVGRMAFAHPAA